MQADGRFTREEIVQALQMAREAILKLYEEQKRALKERYSKVPLVEEEGSAG
jgi:hypothetical protein